VVAAGGSGELEDPVSRQTGPVHERRRPEHAVTDIDADDAGGLLAGSQGADELTLKLPRDSVRIGGLGAGRLQP
jgi:hypothetical protein